MGTAALIVFLSSLALGMLCLLVLAYSGLLIYRTLRYAHRDVLFWSAYFKGFLEDLRATAGVMEERVQGISTGTRELRHAVEDIRDALEEFMP